MSQRPIPKIPEQLEEWDRIIATPEGEEFQSAVLTVHRVGIPGHVINVYVKELRWPLAIPATQELEVY